VEGLLRLAGRAQSAFFPGLRPGSEFAAAARCAAGADLVLADAPVRDTLRELARLGSRDGGRPPPRPLEETRDLAFAVLGFRPGTAPPSALPGPAARRFRPVNLCEFAARSPQARAELVRWLVAPLLAFVAAAQAISFLLLQASAVASGGDGPGALEAAASASPHGDAGGPAAAAAASAVGAALACHLGLVLPAARVVLWERDACLARGIRAACRRAAMAAASRGPRADPPPAGAGGGRRGRVVAVLGFLHVNGVAERLASEEDGEEESQGRGT
jgi:hypothetical protein